MVQRRSTVSSSATAVTGLSNAGNRRQISDTHSVDSHCRRPKTGFGHVRRTCILARASRTDAPLFLLNPDDSWSRKMIEDEHFTCSPRADELWTDAAPAAILIDTRDTSGLESFIARAKDLAVPVISIHDLGLALLPSDIIIDGSVAPPPRDRFPQGTRYYCGPDYMVLDPRTACSTKGPRKSETASDRYSSISAGRFGKILRDGSARA